MKILTTNLFVLLIIVFVLSCKNNESDSKTNQSAQVENVEKTSSKPKTTPKIEATEPCDWLDLKDLNQAFGFNISESADLDGEISDSSLQCLYSFQDGYMQVIKYTLIPKQFKNDASKYLKMIFNNYKNGTNKRKDFLRVENLDFEAGWTGSETKFFGNSLDFVINNQRYFVQVNLPNKPEEERKRIAIEIAKLLK